MTEVGITYQKGFSDAMLARIAGIAESASSYNFKSKDHYIRFEFASKRKAESAAARLRSKDVAGLLDIKVTAGVQ